MKLKPEENFSGFNFTATEVEYIAEMINPVFMLFQDNNHKLPISYPQINRQLELLCKIAQLYRCFIHRVRSIM